MMGILKIIFICIEVLLVFNLLVCVHELGHFLAARWRGLKVEIFAIWFGKALWKKKINGVVYQLGCIPAGGYVKLPQMAPMEAIEGKAEEKANEEPLPPISVSDKVIVAFAGPLFSMGLAVVFAVAVWIVGRPVSEGEAATTIGYVLPDSPAEKAGLKVGDKILEVDNKRVIKFGGMGESVTWRVVRSEGATIPFKVERDGKELRLEATPVIPKTSAWERKGLRQVKIMPVETPMIGAVEKDSYAEKIGLKATDLLVEINGQKLTHYFQLDDYFEKDVNSSAQLTVERKEQRLKILFAPEGAPIASVIPDSPASRAGLRQGDLITAVDGVRVGHYARVTALVQEKRGAPMTMAVLRDKKTIEIKVTPEIPDGVSDEEKKPRIGIAWSNYGIALDSLGKFEIVHQGPIDQVIGSVNSTVSTLTALFSPKSDIKAQHMGGPVMIFRIYYQLFQSDYGWQLVLWFSVVLNVNLALVNFLPIPVLDGGHILIAIIEGARRKPIPVRLLEWIQTGFAVLLISYMLYVTFYDVLDLRGPQKWKFKKPAAEQTK